MGLGAAPLTGRMGIPQAGPAPGVAEPEYASGETWRIHRVVGISTSWLGIVRENHLFCCEWPFPEWSC